MIRFTDVAVTYPGAAGPTLHGVDLQVPEGELALVVGRSGSGKSTLLRAVNGLVPRFSGGTLAGEVRVGGRSTAEVPPRDLADVVGMVGQDPAAGFVTDTVEDELAYVMENLAVPPAAMRRRVEDVLDLLGLHELRQRPLATLSGGQQQRVAIGAVLTASPRVLVLDEPTSALDPAAAEDVLAALARLVHDLGVTVLLAEHRLERVVQFADRVVAVGEDGTVEDGDPAEVLARAPVVPPVVRLARLAGWSPVPLSIRDARRRAGPLRDALAPVAADVLAGAVAVGSRAAGAAGTVPSGATAGATAGDRVAAVRGLVAGYGPVTALRGVDVDLHAGEVVAVMGRNGAGKSTLLAHLAGLRRPAAGGVALDPDGADPSRLDPAAARRRVAFVPQDPTLVLWHQRVDDELAAADGEAGVAAGTARALLDRLVPGVRPDAHPRDLSEGQRLGLALAVVLAGSPALVLLDEPTRGLDEPGKAELACVLRGLADEGRSVVLATHDVEVVAAVADRVVVLADGEVVADGPARDVVSHSPVFAPQVAKVLAPQPWLTVTEVAAGLARLAPTGGAA